MTLSRSILVYIVGSLIFSLCYLSFSVNLMNLDKGTLEVAEEVDITVEVEAVMEEDPGEEVEVAMEEEVEAAMEEEVVLEEEVEVATEEEVVAAMVEEVALEEEVEAGEEVVAAVKKEVDLEEEVVAAMEEEVEDHLSPSPLPQNLVNVMIHKVRDNSSS